jgi:hypothetical protein
MARLNVISSYFALLAVAVVSAHADDMAAIQKKLASEYALTQPTADNTDIVTAGAILVLQKSDLMLGPVSSGTFYQNTYKEGRIQPSGLAKAKSALGRLGRAPSWIPGVGGTASGADAASGAAPRTYVKGEKMWVTKIEVKTENKEQEVVFTLFTDAVNDVRYKGALKFPFPNGTTEDQLDKLVSEVFGIQPQEAQQDKAPAGGQQTAQAGSQAATPTPAAAPAPAPAAPTPAAPAPAAAPLPDIPPPPPPADQPAAPPPTVSLGQTPEQVIAAMGQPKNIVKLAKKETYYYQDFKVIFTAGKVTDVQ